MKMKNLSIISAIIISFTLIFSSCETPNNATKGGVIGAGTGGVIGGVIGSQSGNTGKGAIIGTAVGGAAGALIGHYMDKQAKELEENLDEGTTVERVGEGIKVVYDSGILFGFDSANLTPESRENVRKMAETLNKYKDTEVIIEGHTDSKGAESYNQGLSERRAQAVSTYLKKLNVSSARISTMGYGETMPVADNSTEAGRKENRRVEISIIANEKLKEEAKSGNIETPN